MHLGRNVVIGIAKLDLSDGGVVEDDPPAGLVEHQLQQNHLKTILRSLKISETHLPSRDPLVLVWLGTN